MSGHHWRTRSVIACRIRETTISATIAATAIATTTTTHRSVAEPPDGKGRSRATDDSENSRRAASSTPWITVLANESIAPDATAVGAERPCRWKKRMLTAIRARFEGSATFMYPVASCIPYTGPKGSCAGTEPIVARACVTRGSCATTNAARSHCHDASDTESQTSRHSTPSAASTIVYAASASSASCAIDQGEMRRSRTRSGGCTPTVSAASLRSSSTSTSAALTAQRSGGPR
jgi:hypothetical protein